MPVRVVRSFSLNSSNTAAPSSTTTTTTTSTTTGTSTSTSTSTSSKLAALPLRIWNKNNSYSYSQSNASTTTTSSTSTSSTSTATSTATKTPAPTPSRRQSLPQSLPPSQSQSHSSRGRSPSPLRIGRKISRSLSRTTASSSGSGSSNSSSSNNSKKRSSSKSVSVTPALPTPQDGLPIVFCKRHELRLGPLLGEGGFAQVYACSSTWNFAVVSALEVQKEGDDFQRYAVKIIRPNLLQTLADPSSASTSNSATAAAAATTNHNADHSKETAEVAMLKKTKAIQDFFFEVHILTQLSLEPHPHIITLRGLTTSSSSTNNSNSNQERDLGLILDQIQETLAERIDLWRRQEKQSLPAQSSSSSSSSQPVLLDTKMTYAYQIAQALSHLHQRRILYRDLKPENLGFLKNHKEEEKERLQLFDFGMARELPPPNSSSVEYKWTVCGTQRYMAPEVLLRGQYTLSTDCYTWAMVVWELLALQKPFHYMTPSVHKILVCQQGDRPRIPKDTPDYMYQLLKQCWAQKVNERCSSMEQVCAQLEPYHQPQPQQLNHDISVANGKNDAAVVQSNKNTDNDMVTNRIPSPSKRIPTPSPENSSTMNLSVCTTGTASSNSNSNNKNIIPPSPAPSPAPSPSRQSIFRRTISIDSATDKSVDVDKENNDASMSTAKGGSHSVNCTNSIRPIPPPPPKTHRHHRRVNSGGSSNSNGNSVNAAMSLPPSSSSRHKRTNSGTPVLVGSLPPIATATNSTTGPTNNKDRGFKRSHNALPSVQSVTTESDDQNDEPSFSANTTTTAVRNNETSGAPFARSNTTGTAVDHSSRTSKKTQHVAPSAGANTTGSDIVPSTPGNKYKNGSRSIWNRRTKASPPLLLTASVGTTATTAFNPPFLKHRRTNSGSAVMMINSNNSGNENNINSNNIPNNIPYYLLPVGKKSLPILSHSVPSSPTRSINGSTTASAASGNMSQGPHSLNDYMYEPSPVQQEPDHDGMPLLAPTLDSFIGRTTTVVTPTAPSKARATFSSSAAGLSAALVSPIAFLTYSLSASFDAGTTVSDNGNDGATNNNPTTTTTAAASSKGPSLGDFQRQKHALKERLKQYDIAFARKHGRMPHKREKEPVRALYEHYNALKSYILQLETMKQQLKDYDIQFAQMRGRMPSKTEKQVIRHLYNQYKTKKNDVAVFLQEFNNNPKNDPLRHNIVLMEDDSFNLRRQAGTISLFRQKQRPSIHEISSVRRGSGGDEGGGSSSLLNFLSLGSFDSFISTEGIEVAEL